MRGLIDVFLNQRNCRRVGVISPNREQVAILFKIWLKKLDQKQKQINFQAQC